jgi:hypothetical protein
MLTADLPTTEAENADVHVCFTQLAVFHIPSLKKNWTRFNRYRACLTSTLIDFNLEK